MTTEQKQVEIKSGVPIPRSRLKLVGETLLRLKIGEHFNAPDGMKQTTILRSAQNLKLKVTTRKISDEEFVGIRCWRVG